MKQEHIVANAKAKPCSHSYSLTFPTKTLKFPLAPMGVLVPVSAHARSCAWPPIDNSGNFPAQMTAESP